ncbi:hypothetical protein D9M72_515870 [compost metagenome]
MIHALGKGGAGPAIAGNREPAKAHRKHLDQDQAEPEARYARRQHGEGRCRLVDEGAAPIGGVDAGRQRDGAGDHDREQRQEEGRLGAFRKRRGHRLVEEDRLAEVTLKQLPDIVDILQAERLVEAEPGAQFSDVLLGRLRAEHDGSGVARCHADDDEDDRDDDRHDDDHAHQPLEYVA